MFQSTHPCGVRHAIAKKQSLRGVGFNPRTRVGCDTIAFAMMNSSNRFNPRTRVGCDLKSNPRPFAKRSFNPRTRVGCDAYVDASFDFLAFQSTHPCGVRPHPIGCVVRRLMFQSTHPCGVRLSMTQWQDMAIVSIHAPVWGATRGCFCGNGS